MVRVPSGSILANNCAAAFKSIALSSKGGEVAKGKKFTGEVAVGAAGRRRARRERAGSYFLFDVIDVAIPVRAHAPHGTPRDQWMGTQAELRHCDTATLRQSNDDCDCRVLTESYLPERIG